MLYRKKFGDIDFSFFVEKICAITIWWQSAIMYKVAVYSYIAVLWRAVTWHILKNCTLRSCKSQEGFIIEQKVKMFVLQPKLSTGVKKIILNLNSFNKK